MPAALVDDGVEPSRELRPHVLEVEEGAAIEKRALGLPEAALDAGLGVGLAAYRARAKLVMCGEPERNFFLGNEAVSMTHIIERPESARNSIPII